MKVTVAIPCYNGKAHVGRAIEAILDQSHPPDQILVIDDGSTDKSADIIRRYPVCLMRHDSNKGLATARNTAIAAASGDVLVFVDADAYAGSHLLESLLKGYGRPKVGGVGGQGIEASIHSIADRWRRAHASQSHGRRPKDVDFLYGLCMSFRLDALREVGGFDPAFRTNAEDMDIGLRLSASGYRLHYEPEARVYHQRSDDETSLKRTMAAWYAEAYRARRLNRAQPWRLFAGTLRRIVMDPLKDIFVVRDPALAPLSVSIGLVKMRALLRAKMSYREEDRV
jgi:GT2 family glycosyltransferase